MSNGTVPPEILRIASLLLTQDNQCTAEPMYLVQVKVRTYGFDTTYNDKSVWVDDEGVEADSYEILDLDEEYDRTGEEREGWTKTGYQDTWQYITTFFTQEAADAYCKTQKHRHSGDLRVWVDSAYRNPEFIAIRQYLQTLAGVK